jgi:predicted NAD/FAD-binding protein
MGLDTQHQWKTIVNGSDNYKKVLIESFKDQILVHDGATSVEVQDDGVIVTSEKSGNLKYDKVIFASHADETFKLLKNPTELQKELLSKFHYQKNIATLHRDPSVMPKLKSTWASWNYIIPNQEETYTVYYMNKLQQVSDKYDYFININGDNYVDKSKILRQITYHHPVFDPAAIAAQKKLPLLNTDETPLYFCGSYFRYGFHEDGLMSSVKMCEKMLKREVL